MKPSLVVTKLQTSTTSVQKINTLRFGDLKNWPSQTVAIKILDTFAILRHLRTFRGPYWLFLFLSLSSCYFCYSCYSCDICYSVFLASRKILKKVLHLVTFVILAIFAILVITWCFSQQERPLLLLRFLRHLRTFRGPS